VRIFQKSLENSQKWASTDTRIRIGQKEAKDSKPKPEMSSLNQIHILEKAPLIEEEIKRIQEAKYGEFEKPFSRNGNGDARYLEESNKKQVTNEEWIIRFRESMDLNLKKQDAAIKNLEVKVEQLTQAIHAYMTNESSLVNEVNAIVAKSSPVIRHSNYFPSFESNLLSNTSILSNHVVQEKEQEKNRDGEPTQPAPVVKLPKEPRTFLEKVKGQIAEESFCKNDDFNGYFGDFLELDDLLPKNDLVPFGALSDSEEVKMGMGLDDFSEELAKLLDDQALKIAHNEVSIARKYERSPENPS
ncbi:hypothetical protein Tco_0461144, partial [Tanacetum coccineum]